MHLCRVTGQIQVTQDGIPIQQLNELEWVKGEIWANVWQTYKIVRINPNTGEWTRPHFLWLC